jgi:hypothetical protein
MWQKVSCCSEQLQNTSILSMWEHRMASNGHLCPLLMHLTFYAGSPNITLHQPFSMWGCVYTHVQSTGRWWGRICFHIEGKRRLSIATTKNPKAPVYSVYFCHRTYWLLQCSTCGALVAPGENLLKATRSSQGCKYRRRENIRFTCSLYRSYNCPSPHNSNCVTILLRLKSQSPKGRLFVLFKKPINCQTEKGNSHSFHLSTEPGK